jgi:hypothetical protein
MNGHPNWEAKALPTVVLPDPETPISTITMMNDSTGAARPFQRSIRTDDLERHRGVTNPEAREPDTWVVSRTAASKQRLAICLVRLIQREFNEISQDEHSSRSFKWDK